MLRWSNIEGQLNEFTPQADVYALAATLFFMLTKRDPATASEITRDKILKALPDDISDRTRDAIVNAMKKDKADRTQSVRAFADDLGIDITPRSAGNVTVPTKILKGNNGGGCKKINKTVIIIAVAVMALIAAAAIIINLVTAHDEDKKADEQPVIEEVVTPPVEEEVVVNEPVEEPVTVEEPKQEEPKSEPVKQEESKPQKTDNGGSSNTGGGSTSNGGSQTASTRGTLNLGNYTYTGPIKNGKPDGEGLVNVTSACNFYGTSVESGYTVKATYNNGQLVIGVVYDGDGTKVKTIMP